MHVAHVHIYIYVCVHMYVCARVHVRMQERIAHPCAHTCACWRKYEERGTKQSVLPYKRIHWDGVQYLVRQCNISRSNAMHCFTLHCYVTLYHATQSLTAKYPILTIHWFILPIPLSLSPATPHKRFNTSQNHCAHGVSIYCTHYMH